MTFRTLDEMDVYRDAARYCDRIYAIVHEWPKPELEMFGSQWVRAADSVGANIAESHGRYHYAERLQFLYYARGSAYETLFWIRRAESRGLIASDTATNALEKYEQLIVSLNRMIVVTRHMKASTGAKSNLRLAESPGVYTVASIERDEDPF